MKDLTKVGDLAVVTREKAKVDVGPNVGTQHRTVDVVMLEDSTIVFQCMSPAAPDCDYTNDRAIGVVSHQKSHSGKMIARQKQAEIDEATARAKAAEDELEARRQAASERAVRAAATRNSNRIAAATTTNVTTRGVADIPAPRTSNPLERPVEIGKTGNGGGAGAGKGHGTAKPLGDPELARQAQGVITAYNALRQAEDEFQNVLVGYMRAAQTATERHELDRAIVEKARKWDAYLEFQKLINDEK